MWAGGSKLLESLAVRVGFALFLLWLVAACAQAGGTVPGDGSVDSPIATAADAPGSPTIPQCTVDAAAILDPVAADVLIVFDGSESMGIGFGAGTRYSVLAGVLSNLVEAYQSRIRFGFAQFPGPDTPSCGQMVTGCCAGLPSVGVAGSNGAAVEEALKNVLPLAGNTPTAKALQRARDYYAGLVDDATARYVLLATDGLPSCTLSGALSSSQPADRDGGPSNACQDAVAQVAALASDHITVLVLAVGAELDDDPAGPPNCLSRMAQVGGKQVYSAASPESLQATIEQIFGGVQEASCSLDLSPAPGSPPMVSVYLDGQPIPKNDYNGWKYVSASDAGDPPRIEITGEYCNRIKQFRYSTIVAHYDCPTCAVPGSCT